MTGDPSPARATRYLLAELLAGVTAALLPAMGARVERALIYLLLLRRSLDGARPTPVLAVAEALGLPFETARRHVAALTGAARCRRVTGGILVTPGAAGDPALAAALALAHDRMTTAVGRLVVVGAVPALPTARTDYAWERGLCATADLALAAAAADQARCARLLDRVLLATLLAGNTAVIAADAMLARRYAAIEAVPPAALLRPLRPRAVATALGLPEATVRRRFAGLEQALIPTPAGLSVDEGWLRDGADAAADELDAAVRRQLVALARHGFPFADPAAACRRGTPPSLDFG